MGQPVVQWQILAKDPDKLMKFYTRLFAWESNTDNSLGYRVIDTGSERGINGGIWPSPPEGHSLVSLYVEVDNVAEYAERARDLGAAIIISPQKLPDGDEMAIISDPEGIPVGLVKTGLRTED